MPAFLSSREKTEERKKDHNIATSGALNRQYTSLNLAVDVLQSKTPYAFSIFVGILCSYWFLASG